MLAAIAARHSTRLQPTVAYSSTYARRRNAPVRDVAGRSIGWPIGADPCFGRRAFRWSTLALAAASFLALVTSLLADLLWGRIPNNRARCDRLGATSALTIRMSGLFIAVADGFAIVPIALIVDPSLAEAGMRRGIDAIWVAVSGLVATAGVLSQVELPRITWRLLM